MIDNYGIDSLRPNVIVLKSLDQDISDPIIAGAGEAGGNKLVVVFAQEAAARFTPETKVYLNWRHQDFDNVCGFDMFQEQQEEEEVSMKCGTPHCIWSIGWPRNMKHEGTVEASIVLLDAVSKDETVHFNINVLSDLNGSENQMDDEDFSLFEQALLDVNQTISDTRDLWEEQMYIWFAYHGLAYYPRIDTSDIITPGLPEYNSELKFKGGN